MFKSICIFVQLFPTFSSTYGIVWTFSSSKGSIKKGTTFLPDPSQTLLKFSHQKLSSSYFALKQRLICLCLLGYLTSWFFFKGERKASQNQYTCVPSPAPSIILNSRKTFISLNPLKACSSASLINQKAWSFNTFCNEGNENILARC